MLISKVDCSRYPRLQALSRRPNETTSRNLCIGWLRKLIVKEQKLEEEPRTAVEESFQMMLYEVHLFKLLQRRWMWNGSSTSLSATCGRVCKKQSLGDDADVD